MGWFGKKDMKRDPQTGLISVKVGDTWIQESAETTVVRDMMSYFRGKNMSPGTAIHLSAWVSGFLAGSVGVATNAPADELIRQIHAAVAKGVEAGRKSQDPAIRELYEKSRGIK